METKGGSSAPKPRRRVISVISSISLALGTLTAVPPAFAAELVGEDITAKQSDTFIEKNKQKVSDISGNGSCVVEFVKPLDAKPRAGLELFTINPSNDLPDKKSFGFQYRITNSQDRTFANLTVSDSGRFPVTPGEIPAMAEGSELGTNTGFPKVNRESTKPIGVTTRGGQRNINLAESFSEDDVKNMATPDGIISAWKSQYTADNPRLKAFETDSTIVTAQVNPWPSEQVNCSPITIDWSNVDKAVIKPGEQVKIGTINADDDSLSRIKVSAKTQRGSYAGEVRRDGKDLYYTWPKFIGEKWADDDTVSFTAVALPRNLEQLKAAATDPVNNEDGDDTYVYQSSIDLLERYNKANEISTHTITTDDEKYHDPQYDPSQVQIISGITDGKPATSAQSVTFTGIKDKIADLVKNQQATVELDTELVQPGWKAEFVDPDKGDYTVKVTAPFGGGEPRPGTFSQPVVKVTYTNGSVDSIPLLAIVKPNNTQVTDVTYPTEPATGLQGAELTQPVALKRILGKGSPVKPTSYEVVPGSYPEGWTVTVDADGTVHATSPKDAPNNSSITPKVKATYPDGTTDVVEAPFQVVTSIKVPDYGSTAGVVKDELSLTPVEPKNGLSGKPDDAMPTSYSFQDGATETTIGDWKVAVDPTTGVISTTVPDTALPGAFLTVPVVAHYAGGVADQTITGTFRVNGKGDGKDAAEYVERVTTAGNPVESTIRTQLSDPKLAKYELPKKLPQGWTVTVDESGTVTATPPKDAQPGDSATIKVSVSYPDGTKALVPAEFTVVGADKDANDPSYATVSGKPGTSTTSKVDTTRMHALSEPKYSIITDPNEPGYIAPPRNITWDMVKIDEKTGVITTPISDKAVPGSSADIPVKVTYKDGSTDTTFATVVVVGDQSRVYSPVYNQSTTTPGNAVTSNITQGSQPPVRDLQPTTPYEVPSDINGWKVSVDKDGKVTATPPANARPGNHIDVPVTVHYQDGSSDVVYAPFVVNLTNNYEATPVYPPKTVVPGETVTSPLNLDKPDDVNVSANDPYAIEASDTVKPTGNNNQFGNPEYAVTTDHGTWTVSLDKDGNVVATAPKEAQPGDMVSVPVKVTYADGTTDVSSAEINVAAQPTRPIPFTVEYRYDPTVESGTYKTETVGKPGLAELQNGEWVTTKEAVNEVVVVGTKPAQDSVSWTVPVPYQTVLRENKDLKPGETRVVQKGQNGELKKTVNFEATGGKATSTSEETTKDAVQEIIEYGPKAGATELVTTTTKPVPFTTEVTVDPDLAPGQKVVVQAGVLGEDTETSTQKLVDGEPSGDPQVTTKRTKEPVNEKIRVGALTANKNVTVTDVDIAYETQIVFDPSMDAGTQEVAQAGKPGVLRITTTNTIENSVVTDTQSTQERVTEPTPEIIRVGTKGATPTWTRSTAYGVKVVEDPSLPAGEHRVDPGVPGETKFTLGGDGEVTKTVVTEPKDEVITIGTGDKQTEITEAVTSPVPFNTKVIFDDTLAAGTVITDAEGANGEEVTTKVWKLVNGEKQGDPTTTTVKTADPVDRVLRVGTKSVNIPPTYAKVDQQPGTSAEVPVFEKSVFPEGASYEIDPSWKPGIDGWTATVDENGTVTSNAPKTAKPGDSVVIPVKVTFKDGTSTLVPAMAGIPANPNNESTRVQYEVESVNPGEQVTNQADPQGTENTFEVPATVKGWTVSVDDNGNVTATAPKDAQPGDYVKVPVTVTPKDGSASYTSYAVFTVLGGGTPSTPDNPTVPDKPIVERTPTYPSQVITTDSGKTVTIPVFSGHKDGNTYELGKIPEGWTATIDKDTGELQVTPPETAKDSVVEIPVKVTTPDGHELITTVVVTDQRKGSTPKPNPDASGSSEEQVQRCFANAFATNSPILWLLPVAILAAIGGPISQALQPQINAANAQFNALVRQYQEQFDRHHDNWGDHGRHGRRDDRPEWMREAQAQIDAQIQAINQQFAPLGEQLRPLGYALGALGIVALASTLIAQACQPEGFDHGMTILGSSKESQNGSSEQGKDNNGSSSDKGKIYDAIMNGSSDKKN